MVAVGSGDGHMIVLTEDSGAHVTTVRRTLYTVLYTVHCTLYTVHWTLYRVFIVMVSVVCR